MAEARYVEEIVVSETCSTTAANLERALAERREDAFLFGGVFSQSAEKSDGECARFVLERSLGNDPDAVITIEPGALGESRVTIYQRHLSLSARNLAADVEKWVNGLGTR